MHGVNQRERLIPMSVYRKELAKARLGDNIANHMGFIFTAVLYDKFDMTFKQVTNFYSKTVERRKAWQDDDNEEITSESMMEYCQKKENRRDQVGKVDSDATEALHGGHPEGARSAWSRSEHRERTCIHDVSDDPDSERNISVLECQDRRIYEMGFLLHRFLLAQAAEK